MAGLKMRSGTSKRAKPERRRLLFSGIVQGVGFRPYIYRLARDHGLAGFVRNRPEGVIVEIEGAPAVINAFLENVRASAPPLAEISGIHEEPIEPQGASDFAIYESERAGSADVLISPDVATCPECVAELFDAADRRYRYPFINCTNCGPRLTIISGIPYDRANTSMSFFPLCPDCLDEYEDPANRRFHAEPNACPVCGPSLSFLDADKAPVRLDWADEITNACLALADGKIVAVKGIGGFHLAVDARSSEAVKRLRSRKFREEKPLALMARDLDEAQKIAWMSPEDEVMLLSPERPIVLMQKKPGAGLAPEIAPGMPNLGIMLPYSPLHHLLLERLPVLVMTSGNQVDEPICIDNEEALKRLDGIADYFLLHNRDILVRCDDSIAVKAAGKPRLMRRSRGYAPKPLYLSENYPEVLAVGAQLKSTVCILKGEAAFFSPHIGDLETPEARDFFLENCELLKRVTQCDPPTVACDLHPGYFSTRHAGSLAKRIVPVQHHHAHIAACLAEYGVRGKVIGLAMDGTGFGADGTVWGGELMIADTAEFCRAGHFRTFSLPGSEKAIREPWRIAAGLLRDAFGPQWLGIAVELELIPPEIPLTAFARALELNINAPRTSSLGRLFDAVSALLGVRRKVSFEGQAAMELEGLAGNGAEVDIALGIEKGETLIIDPVAAVRKLVEFVLGGADKGAVAAAFHTAVISALAESAAVLRDRTGLDRVALGGGCFQNRILLEGCEAGLKAQGFEVFLPGAVPCNDGGISLGQAVIVGERLRAKG